MSEEVMNNVVVEEPKKKRKKKKKSLARRIIEYTLLGIFGAFAIFVIAGNIQGEIKKSENYGQSIRFGIGSFIVLTDSMEPEIKQDSAIITYKSDVDNVYSRFMAGETLDITFVNIDAGVNYYPAICDEWVHDDPNIVPQEVVADRVMTHRLIEMKFDETKQYGNGRYIFVTAGINTHTIDEETGEEVINYARAGQYQVFTEKQYLGVVKISNQFLGKVFNFIISPVGLIVVLLVPAAYLIIVSSIDIYKAMKASEETEAHPGDPQGGMLASVSNKDRERLKKELLEEMMNKKKEKDNEKQD